MVRKGLTLPDRSSRPQPLRSTLDLWAQKCGLGASVSFSEGTYDAPEFLIGKMPPKNLSKKLKQIRLKAGLSQTTIVRALNYEQSPLYPSQISQFERGELQPPLLLVLAYAKLGGTCLCVLADDSCPLSE
jgi:hypothetical protein